MERNLRLQMHKKITEKIKETAQSPSGESSVSFIFYATMREQQKMFFDVNYASNSIEPVGQAPTQAPHSIQAAASIT